MKYIQLLYVSSINRQYIWLRYMCLKTKPSSFITKGILSNNLWVAIISALKFVFLIYLCMSDYKVVLFGANTLTQHQENVWRGTQAKRLTNTICWQYIRYINTQTTTIHSFFCHLSVVRSERQHVWEGNLDILFQSNTLK